MGEAEVIVAGHICLDIIPTAPAGGVLRAPGPGELTVAGPALLSTGGAVANTGLALHRLGVRTALMGKVGDDLFGRAVLDIVRGYGPELAEGMIVVEGEHTSYSVVISPSDADRSFLHCPGANDTFSAGDVGDVSGAKLFHFGYPPLMKRMYDDNGRELSSLLRRVKSQGVTTSLDMECVHPESPAGRADWAAILAKTLPHTDVFLPSLDDMMSVLECRGVAVEGEEVDLSGPMELGRRLIGLGAAIVGLKLGRLGLYVLATTDAARLVNAGAVVGEAWRGVEVYVPPFVVEEVGATGAGDCAIAGFLAGLVRGLRPVEVARMSAAVGACNVEAADGVSGVRSWEETRRRLAAGWRQRDLRVVNADWRSDASTTWVRG